MAKLSSYLTAKARYIAAEKKVAELERKINIINGAHKASLVVKPIDTDRIQQLIRNWQDELKIVPAASLNAKQIARFISQLKEILDEANHGSA